MALHHASSGVAVLLRLISTAMLLTLTAMDLYSDFNVFTRINWVVTHYENLNANLTEQLFCTCRVDALPSSARQEYVAPNDVAGLFGDGDGDVAPVCSQVIHAGDDPRLCDALTGANATGASLGDDCALRNELVAVVFHPTKLNGTKARTLCENQNYTLDYEGCVREVYDSYPDATTDDTYVYFQYAGIGTDILKLYQVRAGILIFFVLAIVMAVSFILLKLRGAYNIYSEWRHDNEEQNSLCYICLYHYRRYKDNHDKVSSFRRHLRTAKLHIYTYTLQDLPQHLLFFVAIYYVFAINPYQIGMLGMNPPCPIDLGDDSAVTFATHRMRATTQLLDWNYFVNNYSNNVPPTSEVDLLNGVVFSSLVSCLISIFMLIYNAFGFVHKVQYVARDSPSVKFAKGFIPSFLVVIEMLLRMGFPVLMIGYLFLFITYSTNDPVNVFWGCVALGPIALVVGTILFFTFRPRLVKTFPSLVRNTSFEMEEVNELYRERFKIMPVPFFHSKKDSDDK